MKKTIIIILIFVLNSSCTKTNEETYSYTYVENSMLEIESNEGSFMKFGRVINGSQLVFLYEYNAEDKVNTQDDEYSEFLRFQIEPTLEEFNYSDNELMDINTVFSKSCFCPLPDDFANDIAPKGTISGKKLSETEWDITIDVIFYGEDQRNISNVFKLGK